MGRYQGGRVVTVGSAVLIGTRRRGRCGVAQTGLALARTPLIRGSERSVRALRWLCCVGCAAISPHAAPVLFSSAPHGGRGSVANGNAPQSIVSALVSRERSRWADMATAL